MATRTYKISKGQQYDRGGAHVDHGPLAARYSADGKFHFGSPPGLDDSAAVEAAVARVIATGEAETLTLGQPSPAFVLSEREQAFERELAACRLHSSEGCPMHGELCAR